MIIQKTTHIILHNLVNQELNPKDIEVIWKVPITFNRLYSRSVLWDA